MSVSPPMVTLSVYPDPPSGDAQRSLAAWLRVEDRFRGRVAIAASSSANRAGTMAGGMDVLVVAVGGGGAVAVLIQAVAGWLAQRREDVTVRLTYPDGSSIELDVRRARDPEQVKALVETARQAVWHGVPPSGETG